VALQFADDHVCGGDYTKGNSTCVAPAIHGSLSHQNLSIAVNAVAAAGDVLIAIVLCTILQKARTGFKRYIVFAFAWPFRSFDRCVSSDLTP
jgi:hypothetical protein